MADMHSDSRPAIAWEELMKRRRLNECAPFFRQLGIDSLWHFTAASNLASIIQLSTILSSRWANDLGIEPAYLTDGTSRRLDKQFGGADYVHLSLIPYSPFYRKIEHRHHAWIRVSLDALSAHDVRHSGVNAQTGRGQPQMYLGDIDPVTFAKFRPVSDSFGAPRIRAPMLVPLDYLGWDWNMLSQEILVPCEVRLDKYCEGIYEFSGSTSRPLFVPLKFLPGPRT